MRRRRGRLPEIGHEKAPRPVGSVVYSGPERLSEVLGFHSRSRAKRDPLITARPRVGRPGPAAERTPMPSALSTRLPLPSQRSITCYAPDDGRCPPPRARTGSRARCLRGSASSRQLCVALPDEAGRQTEGRHATEGTTYLRWRAHQWRAGHRLASYFPVQKWTLTSSEGARSRF
jgi:hypothetical protein